MAPPNSAHTARPSKSENKQWIPEWRDVRDTAIGRSDGLAAAPPQLTMAKIGLILVTLTIWRAAIGVASEVWARIGVVEPWPEEIDQLSLLRYSVRWDSGWYLTIARDGYQHVTGEQSPIAFFPMFPMSIRFLDNVLPGSDVLAGLILVHIALLAALIYIYKLVQIDYPDVVAWRTLFFTLMFPASFFFSALYTESLLLLGFAGTLFHARRGQWLLAGAFGIFTGLTKLIGIVLVIPVAMEIIRQQAISRENLRPLIGAALTPLGAVGYLAWIQIRYGDFREYFEAQAHWLRETFSPEPFVLLVNVLMRNPPELYPYPANITAIHDMFTVMDMGTLILFLAAGVYLWLRVRPSYGALVLAGALVPALSGTPLALTRFMAILFPVFILLATIKSEPVRLGLSIVFGMGLIFITYLFVNGLWAG